MSFTVKLLPQAEHDIVTNMLWWSENHSVDEAVSWYDVISLQIQQISNAPESHGLSDES